MMLRRILGAALALALLAGCNWSPKRWGMGQPQREGPEIEGPYFPRDHEVANPIPEPVANTWQSEHRSQIEHGSPFRKVLWDYRVVNYRHCATRPIRKIYNLYDTLYLETEDCWVYAVDKASGTTRWALELEGPLDFAPAVTRNIAEDRAKAESSVVTLTKEVADLQGSFTKDQKVLDDLAKKQKQLEDAKAAIKTLNSLDYLYLVSRGTLISVERRFGIISWKAWPPGGPSGTPYATVAQVFVPTFDRNLVRAYDIANRQWKEQFEARGTVSTQPLFDGDRLIFASEDGAVYGYNPNELPIFPPFQTERPIRAEMTVGPDGMLYVGSTDFAVYAIDRTTAHMRWKYETGAAIEQKPLLVGTTLYVASGGNLFALDTANRGALKWRLDGLGAKPIVETPTRLYAQGKDGKLLGINKKTGKAEKSWCLPFFDFFYGDSETGTLYAGTRDGYLYAAQEMLE